MGTAGPPPLVVQEIQRRIAASPQLTEGLVRVLNHDMAPSEVFTPRIGLAAASSALRRHAGQRKAVLRETLTVAQRFV
jgi:menaquinone-9 beta-reductase